MISANGNRVGFCPGHVAGVVAAVPKYTVTNEGWKDAEDAAKMTGVHERRHAESHQSTETLCLAAARELMAKLDWAPETVDTLVYVTQTPSMAVPASAYGLHAALGLPAHCPVVEVNWSCAGYVYGLWLAMKLAYRGETQGARVLLLVGDTSSKIVDPHDRATAPLFGDAGSATAVVIDPQVDTMTRFVLGSDGADNEKLAMHAHDDHLRMDGAAVFSFTLRTVPGLIADVLAGDKPDFLLFHQANLWMLKHLVKKTGLLEQFNPSQIPTNIQRFGNSSCASIPLLLCDQLGRDAAGSKLALFGYGAGWAWAGATIDASHLRVADLIEV